MVFDPRSENTHVIVGAGFLLKHYAKRAIEDFNEACLLEIQGENIKRNIIQKKILFYRNGWNAREFLAHMKKILVPFFMREKF